MIQYRIYFVGPHGRFRSATDFEHVDDQNAIEHAKSAAAGQPFELWSGGRLVSSFRESPKPS